MPTLQFSTDGELAWEGVQYQPFFSIDDCLYLCHKYLWFVPISADIRTSNCPISYTLRTGSAACKHRVVFMNVKYLFFFNQSRQNRRSNGQIRYPRITGRNFEV